MKNKKNINLICGLLIAFVIGAIFLLIFMFGKEEKDKVIIGFVMTGGVKEQGWNSLHYQGIKDACDEVDAKLLVKENVKENTGDCEKAVAELIQEGARMIILSSYGYANELQNVTGEYPHVKFYSESFSHNNPDIDSFFARAYQARYLAGMIAGRKTESGVIGYVAAMPNNEVNRGINAFTQGVKRVNPTAEVIVSWTESWDDAEKEKEAAKNLIEEKGVDLLTYHQNQPNVVEVAEEYQIYSIGYHQPMENASEKFLTSVVIDWNITYKELVLDYIRGKSDVVDYYWFGIETGAVGLSELSPEVTEDIREEIKTAEDEMKNGFDVFSGEIYDTEGILRSRQGENISDEILLKRMDWYAEGVVQYEK